MGEYVNAIGSSAFYGCTALGDLQIGIGVNSIGDYAFKNCSSLITVDIPESVLSVGYEAFCNCNNLNEITFYYAECKIRDGSGTLKMSPNAVIFGYAGSTAQAYAESNGYHFLVIGTEREYEQGDITLSGTMEVADIVALQQYILNQRPFKEKQFKNADLNGDGAVNVIDLALLKQKFLKNGEKHN